MEIIIIKRDITTSNADAIVNAANNRLWMGAGVAGAIKRAGGKIIEEEAVSKGPIPIGQVIETTAGRLQSRYIIHAAVMGQNLITNDKFIHDATLNALNLAEKLGLSSIAFPALGTGVGGFSKDKCAEIMIDIIMNFNSQNLKKVYFYLFDNESYDAFNRVLKIKLP